MICPSLPAQRSRRWFDFRLSGGWRLRGIIAGLALLALASCEEGNPLLPDDGTIEVEVAGGSQPPNGYTVTLNGNRTRTISQVPGTAVFSEVPSGQHQVELSGFAPGCSALSNPRTVSLEAGGIGRTQFIVAC